MNYATFCMEDDRLRLYVGRVPRDEYEKLRAEGWTSTPKQDCDFVATWTPSREATALSYCDSGEIEDEDQSLEDRAADRAERFSGYRDKRLDEAVGHADRYESGPSAHGYQSQAKADRMAARHDRIGGRAVSQWDKAEYWQQRTAGVISHALYVSSPAVRMGRIKTLEAELRACEKTQEEYAKRFRMVERIAADPQGAIAAIAKRNYGHEEDGGKESASRALMEEIAGHGQHRNPLDLETPKGYLFEHLRGEHPPTVPDYAAHYIRTHHAPDSQGWETTSISRTIAHLKMRLAYENQMLEAQGGRAGMLEMEVGGWIGSRQIRKVNKSNTSGRVVSVGVMGPTSANFDEKGKAYGPDYPRPLVLRMMKVERLAADAYRAPTDEDKQALKVVIAAEKATAPVKDACPLVNPTNEDAERLQAQWNAEGAEKYAEGKRSGRYYGDFAPATVTYIPQAAYSANSKGAYARAETLGVAAGGVMASRFSKSTGKDVCKLRTTYGGSGPYTPKSVIVLTDKPQKPLPASVWTPAAQEVLV